MKLVVEKIYCLYSPQFWGRGKVGVSGNVESRRQQVEAALREKFGQHIRVKCLLALPILTNAYNFESAIHQALRGLRYPSCKTMQGTTGWTEWFWYVNAITSILAYSCAKIAGLECAGAVGFCTLALAVVPLDFALFVLLLAMVEYSIAAAIVWAVYNALT